LPYEELVTLDPSLGLWIRNYLGLWGGNPALLQATGKSQPDEASQVLVEAFWRHLQDRQPRLH
jgi:hypothetical protein